MSYSEDQCLSPNILKRRQDDDEKLLEAEIKRVALNDDYIPPEDNKEYIPPEDINDCIPSEDIKDCIPSEDSKDYIHMRMLCLVKEASIVVGHKGERISRIKKETETSINVSQNIKNVSERVISLRGTCENVAKAFGRISRVINDEEDCFSNERSLPLTTNLLIPHCLMGHVIGKQGSRLREIENLSAARLVAGPYQLPMSNDRILCITGVSDAIHIATYYVSQTVLNCGAKYKTKKTINYQPGPFHSVLLNRYGISIQHQQHHQYNPGDKTKRPRLRMSPTLPSAPNDIMYQSFIPNNPTSKMPMVQNGIPVLTPVNATSLSHVRIIDKMSVQLQIAPIIQEIYIENNMVGNIIGKKGKFITQIKESTGCSIQIDEPVIGLGERKLTIVGMPIGNQTAVMMINNKIEFDKRNQERQRLLNNGFYKN